MQQIPDIAKAIGQTPLTPYFLGNHQGINYRQFLIACILYGSAEKLIADSNWFPTTLEQVVNAAVAIADEVLTTLAQEQENHD